MDVAEQALPGRLDDKRMSGRDRNGYLEGYSMKTRLLAVVGVLGMLAAGGATAQGVPPLPIRWR